jgi:hypothetical protein
MLSSLVLTHLHAHDSATPPCVHVCPPLQNLDLSKTTVILDPLVPGKRVMCIIGFCDIHDFAFIVRSLETEVGRPVQPAPALTCSC